MGWGPVRLSVFDLSPDYVCMFIVDSLLVVYDILPPHPSLLPLPFDTVRVEVLDFALYFTFRLYFFFLFFIIYIIRCEIKGDGCLAFLLLFYPIP